MHFSAIKLAHAVFEPKTTGHASEQDSVLILHGLFGSKKNWESIAKALSQKGLKIITADLRNHGQSPHSREMNYKVMSEDVELLMNDLKLPKAVILGHSMGGKVAMTLALTKPHLVEKLIVEDISPAVSRSTQTSAFPEYISAMRSVKFDSSIMTAAAGRRFASERIQHVFLNKVQRDFVLTNIEVRDGKCRWRINLDAIEEHLGVLVSFPKYDVPYIGETLFIGGSQSALLSEPVYPEIQRLFPKAEIRHIDGAGHWTHSDRPHEFMVVVRNFLCRQQTS